MRSCIVAVMRVKENDLFDILAINEVVLILPLQSFTRSTSNANLIQVLLVRGCQ